MKDKQVPAVVGEQNCKRTKGRHWIPFDWRWGSRDDDDDDYDDVNDDDDYDDDNQTMTRWQMVESGHDFVDGQLCCRTAIFECCSLRPTMTPWWARRTKTRSNFGCPTSVESKGWLPLTSQNLTIAERWVIESERQANREKWANELIDEDCWQPDYRQGQTKERQVHWLGTHAKRVWWVRHLPDDKNLARRTDAWTVGVRRRTFEN